MTAVSMKILGAAPAYRAEDVPPPLAALTGQAKRNLRAAIQWRSTDCEKPAPAGSPRRSASGLLGGGRGQRRETKPGKPAAATTGGAAESATAQRHVGQPGCTPTT